MRTVLVAGVCAGMLLAGCDFHAQPHQDHRVGAKAVVDASARLPLGLWLDAGFPPRGTAGLFWTDKLHQPWSLPCADVRRLGVDRHRTAAYGLVSGHGGISPYLKDRRQLMLYRTSRQATEAVTALQHRLTSCPNRRVVVKDSKPMPGIGDQGRYLRIITRLHPAITYPDGARIAKVGDRVWITRSGRSVLVTDVGYDLETPVPSLPARHLVVVDQLCVFARRPCTLPAAVTGAGGLNRSWLPQPSQLGLFDPSPTRVHVSTGTRATQLSLCSQGSLASLKATAVLRGDYSPASSNATASVLMADFNGQEAARRAQMQLNAWMGECWVGLDLSGRFDDSGEDCWTDPVRVPQGDARACSTDYLTREAPDYPTAGAGDDTSDATDGLPGELILQTGVLRVGTRVVVVEESLPYDDASDGSLGAVPQLLRRLARTMPGSGRPEPTYDGQTHLASPVTLGASVAQLRRLRNPLVFPVTSHGCTQVRLRNGSEAVVDHTSKKVVAVQLGGADTTARGLAATSPLPDARAAYPEGRRVDHHDEYGEVFHDVVATLPDGSRLRYTQALTKAGNTREVRVWLPHERCAAFAV